MKACMDIAGRKPWGLESVYLSVCLCVARQTLGQAHANQASREESRTVWSREDSLTVTTPTTVNLINYSVRTLLLC